MIPAIEWPTHRTMAPKTVIVIMADRRPLEEFGDRRAVNRTIVIPSLIQFNQHVGFCGVEANLSHKSALRRFGAFKSV